MKCFFIQKSPLRLKWAFCYTPDTGNNLVVKVYYTPDSRKCWLNGKGVNRQVESEAEGEVPNRRTENSNPYQGMAEHAEVSSAHSTGEAVER